MFAFTELGETIAKNPKAAAKQIRAMLRGVKGNVTLLAQALKVHPRTLWRWFDKLDDAGHSVRQFARKRGRPAARVAA